MSLFTRIASRLIDGPSSRFHPFQFRVTDAGARSLLIMHTREGVRVEIVFTDDQLLALEHILTEVRAQASRRKP